MQLEEGELHQMSKTENNPIDTVLSNAAGNVIQDTWITLSSLEE